MANQVTIRVATNAKDAIKDVGGLQGAFEKLKQHSTLAATAAGAAVGSMAVSSVQAFSAFEKGMNEVFTLLPGISKDAMGKMTNDVLAFSNETGKLPDEVIPSLYQALSAGVPPDNVFDFLKTANMAAVAGVAETADVVGLLTAVTKGYGDTSAETTQKVADLSFRTVQLGQTTMPELAASMGQVVPLASAMGVSMEELYAATATLTGVTGNTSQVMTQLKATMVALANPNETLKRALAELGFASGDAAVEALGYEGALKALMGTQVATTEGSAKMLGSSEALTAALALTGAQAETYTDNLGEMNDATGVVTEGFKTMESGVAAQASKIAANVKTMMLRVGGFLSETGLGPIMTAFGPTFGKLLGGAIGGTAGFIVPKLIGLIKGLIPHAAAQGALVGAAEGQAQASAATSQGVLRSILAKFGLMTPAKVAAGIAAGTAVGTAEGGAAATAMGGPAVLAKATAAGRLVGAAWALGAVSVAVVAAKIAGDEMTKALGKARETFAEFADTLGPQQQAEARNMAGAVDHFANALGLIVPFAKDAAQEVRGLAADMRNSGLTVEDAGARWEIFARNMQPHAATIREAGRAAQQAGRDVMEGLESGIQDGGPGLTDRFTDVMDGLGTIAMRAGDRITDEFEEMPRDVAGALRSGKGFVGDAMDDLMFVINNPLKRQRQIAKIEAALMGENLAAGLNSADPAIRAQALATQGILIDRWETLTGKAYTHGGNIGDSFTAGVEDAPNPKVPPLTGVEAAARRAYGVGLTIGEALMRGYNPKLRAPTPTPSGRPGAPQRRQHGGSVTRGEAYIVGEAEPELFVPEQSGRILPSVNMQSPAGGVTVNINGNIYGGRQGLRDLYRDIQDAVRQGVRGTSPALV